MIAAGLLLGLYCMAIAGERWLPDADGSLERLLEWLYSIGLGMLGLIFLAASFLALRHRRRAGLLFLAPAPFVAFCLAYRQATAWVDGPDGIHGCLPAPLTALTMAFLFFLPFVAPLLARRNRKRAVFVFLILAPLAALLLSRFMWTPPMVPGLAAWSAPFAVFGAFWLATDRLGWPPPIASPPRPLWRRLATVFAACFPIVGLEVVATSALTAGKSSYWNPGCIWRGPSLRPRYPGHTVLTARLIRVGHTARVSGKWGGYWAIGLVQERFWGLPKWAPPVVLLTNNSFLEGETYFIDGRRGDGGLLTRFLPIVDAWPCYAFAAPAALATTNLRLLRNPQPAARLRLIGRVMMRDRLASDSGPFSPPTVLAGVSIRVTGSAGTSTVTTDRDGIYEVDGLLPDTYTFKFLNLPNTQYTPDRTLEVTKKDLDGDRAFEIWHLVAWNGTIQGRVRDAAGGPARVHLELRRLDASFVPAASVESGKTGSFRMDELSPGRYILMIDPYGPTGDSPYGPQYCPSMARPEDEGVFVIGEGQHLADVICAARRLAKRTLQVRVAWPDGRPMDGAQIHVVYEHSASWGLRADEPQSTDGAGIARIHIFGDSRVRLWARHFHHRGDTSTAEYSAAVELEAARLPPTLDLVASSSEPPAH
jgi:hypothetical protein